MSKRPKSLEPKYRDLLREPERILVMPRPVVLHMHRVPWAELRDGAPEEGVVDYTVSISALNRSGKLIYGYIEEGRTVAITGEDGRVVAHIIPWFVALRARAKEMLNSPTLEGAVMRAVAAYRQAVLHHLLYGAKEE